MVKVGFIVEGDSETILIKSPMFRNWCQNKGLSIVDPVINAGGGGNLLPKYLVNYLERFLNESEPPEKIAILTDRENAVSYEEVRKRILGDPPEKRIDFVFIAVKALEAWFLADDVAISKWLNEDYFFEEFPEKTEEMPWERLKEIAKDKGKRGPGATRPIFTRKILKCGFSLEQAAKHANCPSVKMFHDTLLKWGKGS